MSGKRTRHVTKARILEAGFEVLCVGGVASVTLGSVARRVGMSKSGLFAHFKSIEQIHLALVAHANEVFRANVIEPALEEPRGLARLAGTITLWLDFASGASPSGGWPLPAAVFEYDHRSGVVRDLLLAQEIHWRDYLVKLVQDTITVGAFSSDLNSRLFVAALCGIAYNCHVSVHFLRDESFPYIAKRTADALVAAAMK